MDTALQRTRKEHWESVYRTKTAREVSWHQVHPVVSLRLIEATGVGRAEPIIDVGGGASLLVDHLLDVGFESVAVLDVSATALEQARRRLGDRASLVRWIDEDVTRFQARQKFAVWHDRAVFHFLTNAHDRTSYVRALMEALRPGGQAIIATFAVDGPTKCSGLDVTRYDSGSICAALGDEFELIETVDEAHITPWNSTQRFTYFRFQRRD